MAKFSEDVFAGWAKPPSDTEETKLSNAERMIRDALKDNSVMQKLSYQIFGQGSYANDTNVRLNSDIDINIRLNTTVHVDTPPGKTMHDYGYSPSNYTFTQYKTDVYNALVKCFGVSEVVISNKCIKIKANTNRVEADVVPTFRLDEYWESGQVRKTGSWFMSDDGKTHMNFALQHIENGKIKNASTSKRFKRLCRIIKRIRYRMLDEKVTVNPNVTSFLIESLLYNVPDNFFNGYLSWTERLHAVITYLYNQTKDGGAVNGWCEVSGCLYLFHSERKWSIADVNAFTLQLWRYLDFS